MNPLKPNFKIAGSNSNHGVDLQQLRKSLDKLHSIPQLEVGMNGKLSRVAPKPRELSDEEKATLAIKALANCMGEAEGDFIHETIKRIFTEDHIHLSFNRRFKMMLAGNVKPMADMLGELEIKIEHVGPPAEYVANPTTILYRRIIISKANKIRAERYWEWSEEGA